MNNKLQVFDAANYPHIQPVQGFSYSYTPPGKVRVRGNVQGDTFVLDSSMNCWKIIYGGVNHIIDWDHVDLVGIDKSFLNLWRHHLTEEVQNKSPATIYRKFKTLRNIALDICSNLSLVSLLEVFSCLYSENHQDEFFYLRVFYAWGVSHGFSVFDVRIQKIINDLPAPQSNPYESIFLQQNYVTPIQEARLLKYIDMSLTVVENKPNHDFDVAQYRELRDSTLMLLIYEVAPRALQVHMLERRDIKEIDVDGNSYYSIRLRRNKNRHRNELYTSRREISIRLGNLIKKLILLNITLLNQSNDETAPIFISNQSTRLASNEISMVVSAVLKAVFGTEKLDVKGAIIPFRHHLGQALADQGAPPAVIADRLGHSTEVAARAYIAATPNIAKIKTRALGENETYQYLMNALMTGSIIRREDLDDDASIVRGTVGSKYIVGIGACDVNGICHSNPIYACYTCRKFHPFVDGPHNQVVQALQEQVGIFIDATTDLQHSRPITQLEIVIESAKAVARECEKYDD